MTDAKREIVHVRAQPLAPGPLQGDQWTPEDLVREFLSRRSELTARAYDQDLRDFSEYLHVRGPAEAVATLFSAGQGRANALVFAYTTALRRLGKSPATINRRLACVRSIVKLGRMVGLIAWTLDVPRLRNESYTDTAGPGLKRIREIFADLQGKIGQGDRKALRDAAIVRLLFHGGLRCHEITGVDLKHYDADRKRLHILGKQRARREWITVSPKAAAAVDAWLELRGDRPGPLFVSMRRGGLRNTGRGGIVGKYARLHREDLYRLLKPYNVRPHALRHAAITAALDVTEGDVRAVQRFSRHKNLNILLAYDDNRQDLAGKVAAKLDDLA